MTPKRQAGTHVGQPAAFPEHRYDPPPDVIAEETARVVVHFVGEDGREKVFNLSTLPLPSWHSALAPAFAAWIGPAGSLRTLASALHGWNVLGRFMRFLDTLPDAPKVPRQLTATHVESYLRHRVRVAGTHWLTTEVLHLRPFLGQSPLREMIGPAVFETLNRRVRTRGGVSTSGYSESEFARVVGAARSDVAAMRDRIDKGEQLLESWTTNPTSLNETDASVGEQLAESSETGVIPRLAGLGASGERQSRIELARRLFLTRDDLEPLLILMAAVTGRNSETLKELPSEHRILDGRAVEIQVIKRRRGPQRWHDTVTWEIGPPHRELSTPGGLYLLAHRLMARGRGFHGSPSIWSMWSNGHPGMGRIEEHRDPFARSLSGAGGMAFGQWARRHDLRADPVGDSDQGDPLPVHLRRIRTSVEVRRTKAVGGHLPSAARSNTAGVLFANYLRGDATAQEWAEEVLGEAVADAEAAALAVHRHTLADGGQARLRVELEGAHDGQGTEGAWTACADPHAHPVSGKPCREVSFLDCFHCRNSLITRTHLPAILALLDTLARRRTQLSDDDWWKRYGPVWAAIRRDVLPRFTPAEIKAAETSKSDLPLLELSENPWGRT